MNNNIRKMGRNTIQAFVQGFASAFDLTGGTYIFIPDLMNGQERDKAALREDWNRIGNDIKRAMFMVTNEQ
jgi:hypothetical protein